MKKWKMWPELNRYKSYTADKIKSARYLICWCHRKTPHPSWTDDLDMRLWSADSFHFQPVFSFVKWAITWKYLHHNFYKASQADPRELVWVICAPQSHCPLSLITGTILYTPSGAVSVTCEWCPFRASTLKQTQSQPCKSGYRFHQMNRFCGYI